jgi:hypothetical protein
MEALLKKIEGYCFSCEAGPLEGCRDWQELKKLVALAQESPALSAFDKAVDDELPCVSVVPYNSHEICKWFAGNVRQRLAAHVPSGAAEALEGRFFVDHGVLHDRKTGMHWRERDGYPATEDCDSLNAIEQAAPGGVSERYLRRCYMDDTEFAQTLTTPPAAGVSHGEAVETAWLVERHDLGPIHYLCHNSLGFDWTPDHLKACRFARRSDAEQMAEGGELLDLRICEHQWGPSC